MGACGWRFWAARGGLFRLRNRRILATFARVIFARLTFMFALIKKELAQYCSSLAALVAVVIFLLLNSLFLFVFSQTDVLSFGYATLDTFFDLSPYILIQLIGALTMRSFADEFASGTYTLLAARPLTDVHIVLGKSVAAMIIVGLALVPTLVYGVTLSSLTANSSGLDRGEVLCGYLGLLLIACGFVMMGVFASSLTNHSVIALLMGVFLCYMFYDGFSLIARIAGLRQKADFFFELIGIGYHFDNLRKGIVDSGDIVYFGSLTGLFFCLTLGRLDFKRRTAI